MDKGLETQCRGCGRGNCESIGRLPDARQFAGLRLPKPLPGGVLYRCLSCYLVFRSPICTDEEYGHLYERASPRLWSHRPWTIRNDQELVRRHIEAEYPNAARILDVG